MSKQAIIFAVCLAILNLSSPSTARAELVATLQAVESQARAQDLARVSAALARHDVRAKFVELGVDPATVDARVSALTDPELRMLADRMDRMPAGGDFLALIGVVFVVLIILELVGVIDIFKKIP